MGSSATPAGVWPANIRAVEDRLPTSGQSPEELQSQLRLLREGRAFLVHRDASGVQRQTVLEPGRRARIGRADDADVELGFDPEVSRLHAEIENAGGEWLVIDDGLSSNGTFLGGQRVAGRRRLRDRDVVRAGRTAIVFRNPLDDELGATIQGGDLPGRADLTRMQLEVLDALCAPLRSDSVAAPATNGEIAAALSVSESTVKAHLRALFARFGVDELPQTRKRIRLAELALVSGAASLRG